jgi:hypothetical protein
MPHMTRCATIRVQLDPWVLDLLAQSISTLGQRLHCVIATHPFDLVVNLTAKLLCMHRTHMDTSLLIEVAGLHVCDFTKLLSSENLPHECESEAGLYILLFKW